MSNFSSFLSTILTTIKNLTAEQIALLSLAVSLIIYLLGKRYDIKLKKHEAKKEHYSNFIELFFKVMLHVKVKDDNWMNDEKLKQDFFDAGASLAIYGSKKLYRLYVFSRNIDNNTLVLKSKYYTKDIMIYLYAKIFRLIRKEVGLNSFDNIKNNEILAFFINDIGCNPIAEKKSIKMAYMIRMLKLELFFIDTISFVHISAIYNRFVRPIFGFIMLLCKYAIILPIYRLFFKKHIG